MPPTLAELKSAGYKRADAWWTVFLADPIAIRVLWLLVRVRPSLSPNTVTTASLITGLAAAALFADGRVVAGVILYQASFVLDCVDGKLARWQRRTSPFGSFYDGFVNTVVFVAALLGVALWLENGSDSWAAAGAVALVALRAITLQANLGLSGTGRRGWSATYRSADESWLTRHRLLPPLSFPDKHAILFVLGPLLDVMLFAILANLLLEVVLLALKVRRAVQSARRTAMSHGEG